MKQTKFNVRVYGILIDKEHILVSDERIHGQLITKFPGGGLEFGEGTVECLVREFMEETGTEVTVKSHFYTTDFFQSSAFNPGHQIISIYYLVETLFPGKMNTSAKKFDFPDGQEDTQAMRWIRRSDLNEDDFTFPIDKKVAVLLKNQSE